MKRKERMEGKERKGKGRKEKKRKERKDGGHTRGFRFPLP